MNFKLRIGVSACLIGLKYRYDGESSLCHALIDGLRDQVEFVPVCPEVECGLAVPRPKMRLEVSPKGTRMKVIETGSDLTEQFLSWADPKLEQLDRRDLAAFIFKSKSPSCGLGTTKLFDPSGRIIRTNGDGIFAKLFTRRFPDMIVGSESDLEGFIRALRLELNLPEKNGPPQS